MDDLAEALVDGKFLIQVTPVSAVGYAQMASVMDKAGRLHDALGELEADSQLVVERLSGFSSVFNLMLFEAECHDF